MPSVEAYKQNTLSSTRTEKQASLGTEKTTPDETQTQLMEIRVALKDGSIQPLLVDPNIEIYDLVYAVAEEIGMLLCLIKFISTMLY